MRCSPKTNAGGMRRLHAFVWCFGASCTSFAACHRTYGPNHHTIGLFRTAKWAHPWNAAWCPRASRYRDPLLGEHPGGERRPVCYHSVATAPFPHNTSLANFIEACGVLPARRVRHRRVRRRGRVKTDSSVAQALLQIFLGRCPCPRNGTIFETWGLTNSIDLYLRTCVALRVLPDSTGLRGKNASY